MDSFSARRREFLAGAALLLAGCHRRRTRPVAGPAPPPIGSAETGMASWYGHPYHGRQAASGEIYDMEKLTAAHRTLPFQTWVRVSNLTNGKSVELRINDRGPFVGGRIIDVSHAAARALEMIGPGTARVRVQVIRAPETPAGEPPARFAVQVGAFRSKENAERLRRDMERRYGSARLVRRDAAPPMWRVLVGSEASEEGATALAGRIREEASRLQAAFVVRVDSV